ncbi:hypothetical protein NPIL_11711 [Nephila pilipes]|uniref:Uncharacterized protein n=1 Tax=Nephila pilipes TaxID=299642 RepID=A0A8X6MW86_NEPPI|nr:hypothetical protein NPIL_11711 [Nephila pilipes]
MISQQDRVVQDGTVKSIFVDGIKITHRNSQFHQLLAEFPQLTKTSITIRHIKHYVEHCIGTTDPLVFAKPRLFRLQCNNGDLMDENLLFSSQKDSFLHIDVIDFKLIT